MNLGWPEFNFYKNQIALEKNKKPFCFTTFKLKQFTYEPIEISNC